MERKKPKLILCDVDGTLIDPSQKITPAFDELKELLKKNSLRFSLCSGRSLDQLQMYVDKLEIKEPVIINNGAGAREQGRILWDTYFPAEAVREAVQMADQMDMAIFMCHGNKETVYRYNAYVQREMDLYERYNHFYIPLKREWPVLQLERLMITDPQKPGRIDQVLPYLERHGEGLTILRYDDRHVDVMKKGVSKGRAMKRLAEELGLSLSDIMAIGDGANDRELLETAGIGAAVGNAGEALKACADYVCRESYTRGVIEAVRHVCL